MRVEMSRAAAAAATSRQAADRGCDGGGIERSEGGGCEKKVYNLRCSVCRVWPPSLLGKIMGLVGRLSSRRARGASRRDDGAAVNGLVEAKRLFGATSLPPIVGWREGACDMTSGSAPAQRLNEDLQRGALSAPPYHHLTGDAIPLGPLPPSPRSPCARPERCIDHRGVHAHGQP